MALTFEDLKPQSGALSLARLKKGSPSLAFVLDEICPSGLRGLDQITVEAGQVRATADPVFAHGRVATAGGKEVSCGIALRLDATAAIDGLQCCLLLDLSAQKTLFDSLPGGLLGELALAPGPVLLSNAGESDFFPSDGSEGEFQKWAGAQSSAAWLKGALASYAKDPPGLGANLRGRKDLKAHPPSFLPPDAMQWLPSALTEVTVEIRSLGEARELAFAWQDEYQLGSSKIWLSEVRVAFFNSRADALDPEASLKLEGRLEVKSSGGSSADNLTMTVGIRVPIGPPLGGAPAAIPEGILLFGSFEDLKLSQLETLLEDIPGLTLPGGPTLPGSFKGRCTVALGTDFEPRWAVFELDTELHWKLLDKPEIELDNFTLEIHTHRPFAHNTTLRLSTGIELFELPLEAALELSTAGSGSFYTGLAAAATPPTFETIAQGMGLTPGAEAERILNDFTVEMLAFRLDFPSKAFMFQFAIGSTWKAGDVFEIDQIGLEVYHDTGFTVFLNGAFAVGDVHFQAQAEIGSGDVSLGAETAPGASIPIGTLVEDLASAFGSSATLPAALESMKIGHVGLSATLSGTKEFQFACSGSVEVEGHEIDLALNIQVDSDHKFEFTGEVTVGGRQFEVDISDSQAAQAFVLASYSSETGDKIKLSDLLSEMSPALANDVPFDIEIDLEEALFAVHKGESLQVLGGLMMDVPLDFSKFPLVGGMLPSGIGFHELQLMAASADVPGAAIQAMNTHLAAPKKPIRLPPGDGSMLRKGFSLTGSLDLGGALHVPLQLHSGGGTSRSQSGQGQGDGNGSSEGTTEGGDTPPAGTNGDGDAASAPTFPPGPGSQQQVGKKLGPINFKKAGLSCSGGDIGLEVTGGLGLAAFEFELLGLEIEVPIEIFEDPSQIEHVHFGLHGFSADIHKGTLAIAGGFLETDGTAPDGSTYHEYSGIIQIEFPPFALTGMGSYAKYEGHTSLFLFVALGIPISVNPSVIFTGMALGFGIHRNAIPPQLDQVVDYPLVAASVTPPPPIHLDTMIAEMNADFPPMLDEYFVVAGIKFRAFGLINNLAMLMVKFGRQFEIDLFGVSSVFLAATFVELEWEVRFVPAEGYLFLGGQLTNRSYLLEPTAHLTGGFAVAAWMLGEHQGEFVVTVGGYAPSFPVPAYYPQHVPRLGISLTLGGILTVRGGVFFAVTPKAIMMGGGIDASLHMGPVTGYLKATIDLVIWYQPFHFDARLSVDAGVKVDLSLGLFTVHINLHLHAGMHVWGPAFAGVASLDVHVKTFHVAFGDQAKKVLPATWEKFQKKFLPEGHVCSVAVTGGLIRKVKTASGEIYVVNPRHLALEAKTVMPFTGSDAPGFVAPIAAEAPGIAPMDVKSYRASYSVAIERLPDGTAGRPQEATSDFHLEPILSKVPAAIWGNTGLVPPTAGAGGAMTASLPSGFVVTPGTDPEAGATSSLDPAKLAFETDKGALHCALATDRLEVADGPAPPPPIDAFASWTGLEEAVEVSNSGLLSTPRTVKLARASGGAT